MLARYTAALHETPVRYALNPLVEEAIHNWIRGQLVHRNMGDPLYAVSAPDEIADTHQAIHGRAHDQLPALLQSVQNHQHIHNIGAHRMGSLEELVHQYHQRLKHPEDHYAHQAYLQDTEASEQAGDQSRAEISKMPGMLPAILGLLHGSTAHKKVLEVARNASPGVLAGRLPDMLHLNHLLRTHRHFGGEAGSDLEGVISRNVGIRDQHEAYGKFAEHATQGSDNRPNAMLPEDYYAL